jgi:acetyl-CoA C-acetyltransferase
MREVAIIGVGCTKFGEMWDVSFRDLFVEAGSLALEDGNVEGDEIDALYGGNMSAGLFIGQEHIGAIIADYSGLASQNIPSIRVEAACASGGVALRQAIIAVASGYHDIVIAAGVEKMTDVCSPDQTDIVASAADREWEGMVGATFPSLYAMMARSHMNKYGTTREQLAMVAVKNHHNALFNPCAQFRMDITVDNVLSSPMVSDPLHVLDCSPTTDGAAAIILCPAEIARRYTDSPVYILSSAQASDSIALADRRDICTIDATAVASKKAYKEAKLSPTQIDVAEVHDCFTIAEIIASEDLGFFEKGEGGKAVEDGETAIGGRTPLNPSGGLKACGHPLGATGIKQAVEITLQLRGMAGKRQVQNAEVGLCHNVGGTGGTAVVHILSSRRR